MIKKSEDAFKLKAQFFPVTVIKFVRCDQRSVLNQLKQIQRAAPNYFHHSPAVIDLTLAKRPAKGIDLEKLCELLREFRLTPIGVQGLAKDEEGGAHALNLAIWQQATSDAVKENVAEVAETVEESSEPVVSTTSTSANLVITRPVRSGMRVYAKQTNLVLLAPVSSGAECIADGDIFCYAPVRGRLLAGASGDQQAHIFTHHLEAELISIAGYYLIYDECPAERDGSFQISLKEGKIQIDNFSLERSVLCQK